MRANRLDSNQPSLVEFWEGLGIGVQRLNAVKDGCPDVLLMTDGLTLMGQFDREEVVRRLEGLPGLIVYAGANLLVEIKDGAKPPSKRKLSEDEEKWWGKYETVGAKVIVKNEQEALGAVREA